MMHIGFLLEKSRAEKINREFRVNPKSYEIYASIPLDCISLIHSMFLGNSLDKQVKTF